MHILARCSSVSSLSNLNANLNSNFWQCFYKDLENVILKWILWTKLEVGKWVGDFIEIYFAKKCNGTMPSKLLQKQINTIFSKFESL